ncbi:uncharacterized protein YfeS [Chryseobacterium sp. H1D6B]|uniref:hypothetical protein n=1 Tax=Chryseobacterium sp. H1D6B TaxID=2940588 RepID=UPI0015CB045A|nr:hypothetical protein [Chryseobacterium sp. H1D6B]MDH6254184.1 uncharacterized protein YfeS [Chryseobacterium sp. H1D6B]
MRKLRHVLAIATCIFFYGFCNAQDSPKYKEIEWKNGSEAAKKIMVSTFYYDPLDAWSPFGNDIGSDTYYLYCDWRREHSKENIRKFIDEELAGLGYPGLDISMDGKNPEKLKSLVNTMRNNFVDLNAIDNIVISVAFSQLFLDGRIEPEVKNWSEAAFSRESVYLDFWGDEKEGIKKREERMTQLLNDLRKG